MGMRIAQMVIANCGKKKNWNIVGELAATDRGASGFGSTGQ
jgi:dUTPase